MRLLCPWGFSRQECWIGLLCPPPGDIPKPGVKPRSPSLQADSLLPESPVKPIVVSKEVEIKCCNMKLIQCYKSMLLQLKKKKEVLVFWVLQRFGQLNLCQNFWTSDFSIFPLTFNIQCISHPRYQYSTYIYDPFIICAFFFSYLACLDSYQFH